MPRTLLKGCNQETGGARVRRGSNGRDTEIEDREATGADTRNKREPGCSETAGAALPESVNRHTAHISPEQSSPCQCWSASSAPA